MTRPPEMQCASALLIHLRGDDAPPDEQRAMRVHIMRCPACASTVDELDHDETSAAAVLQTLAAHQARASWIVRCVLTLFSFAQFLIALPWLFGANPLTNIDSHVGASHLTRDGAIGVLVAVAGLLAAYRPRYSVPAAMVATVGVITQVVSGTVDERHEHVNVAFELLHLVAFAIVVLAAVVAGSRVRTPGNPLRQSRLRAVEDLS